MEPRNADLKKNLKEIDELIRGEKVAACGLTTALELAVNFAASFPDWLVARVLETLLSNEVPVAVCPSAAGWPLCRFIPKGLAHDGSKPCSLLPASVILCRGYPPPPQKLFRV